MVVSELVVDLRKSVNPIKFFQNLMGMTLHLSNPTHKATVILQSPMFILRQYVKNFINFAFRIEVK